MSNNTNQNQNNNNLVNSSFNNRNEISPNDNQSNNSNFRGNNSIYIPSNDLNNQISNFPSNDPITYPDNYPSNEPITYPDNYPSTNTKNTNKNGTDGKSTDLNTSTDAPQAKPKSHSKKSLMPSIKDEEPDIDSNNQPAFSQNPDVIRFKELFVSNPQNVGYSVYCFDFQSYEKVSTENGFDIFVKNFIDKFSYLNLQSNNNIRRIHSNPVNLKNISDSIYTKSLSIENYTRMTNIEIKKKLNHLKQYYLAHSYDQIPAEINQNYLADQVNYYMNNYTSTLANFHGFSMANDKGQFAPAVLTDRPVNGPLSSLFEAVKMNQSENGQIDCCMYFNIDQIRSIDSDQKYAMICGVTHAIKFMHEANFIHSNLSPETVYLDENLHPVVCDYIYIPPYKVETLPEKGANNQNEFSFHFDFELQKVESAFKNSLYVAPEVSQRGEISEANDIYSLGLVIYFITAEKEAKFDDQKALNYPSNINPKLQQLIEDCISEDASKRLTASSLLEELFEMETIENSKSSPLSESTQNYLTLLKAIDDDDDVFDIIHRMIPNLIEIDVETRHVIQAAENGDVKQIEKVGDFFYNGHNNIHQDEEWAYQCYDEASARGSARSSILVGQFFEEGIGREINFTKAKLYYQKALTQMPKSDERRPAIMKKVAEMQNYERIVIFTNIPIKTTEKEIQNALFKYHFVIEETTQCQEDNRYKQVRLKFSSKNEVDELKKEINNSELNLYSFDGIKVNCESPSVQLAKTSYRFSSLSKALKHIDNLDDYQLVIEDGNPIILGEGKTATTYLVKEKNTNETYAAKVYQKPLSNIQITFLKREIIMASKFDHPCILKYYGFNEFSLSQRDCKHVMPTLIMNYIPNGTLESALKRNSQIEKYGGLDENFDERLFDDTCKLKAIIGLAGALNEMFDHNIVHRDLKPENILLNERLEPIICDFGLSRQFSNLEHHKMTDNLGTPFFMAPELFNSKNNPIFYRYEIDVYAFGIIVYQILTNTITAKIYPPKLNSQFNLIRYKLDNYVPKLPDDMSEVFKDLIVSCWNVVKDERPQPPLIFDILVNAVLSANEPLLKGADMKEVKKYIKTLIK